MNIQSLVELTTGQQKLPLDVAQNKTLTALRNEGSSTTSTDTSVGTAEEFNTFLTLLTAQIKNQDPLAPLDSTQFVEQLATFSSLELQAKGNQTLEEIVGLLRRDP